MSNNPNRRIEEIDSELERASVAVLLDTSEACALLKLSRETLYGLIEDGQLEASKVSGSWRFTRGAISRFLAMNENTQS